MGESIKLYAFLEPSETVVRHPERIFVEGMTDVSVAATPSVAGGEEDDFFSSWDKPASKPTSSATSPATVPVLGRAASAAAAAPRTISSSSLRSSTTSPGSRPASKLGASRLNSSPAASTVSTPTAAAGGKKSKLGGLGAKKAAAPIDFEQAEKRATEEAERIRQLGYDRERERQEEEVRAKKEAENAKVAATARSLTPANGKTVAAPAEAKPLGSAQDMERLGMGMKRLGFGAAPAASSPRARCVFSAHVHTYGPS